MGDLLTNPNPSPAVDLLIRVVRHLTQDCAWPADRIHLFGSAQGGTVAAELGVRWWREELERARKAKIAEEGGDADVAPRPLASVVSVSGPLISYPTLKPPCPTPVLLVYRPSEVPGNALAAFRKGYADFSDVNLGGGEGMPRSKDEWEPIMRFWSQKLGRRQMQGLYEVMSGSAPQ